MISDLLVAAMNWKDVWRCVLTISGALCVIVIGRLQKVRWLAGRLDSLTKVNYDYIIRSYKLLYMMCSSTCEKNS